MLTDVVSAFVRALSFIALFQAAGVAIFVAIFGRRLERASPLIRRIGFASTLAALLLVSVHYSLEAARMAGVLAGVFDFSLQQIVLESPMSTAGGVRIAGLALIAVAINREGAAWTRIGVGGAALTIAGFLFVGHTASHADRGWLVALLSLHLAVVAFWFGALLPLIAVTLKENGFVAAQIVEDFSRIATWWVPAILVAGVLLTAALVDRWAVFGESYGALLLAKVASFAVLMALAGLNKWRYGPALSTEPGVAPAFRRSVAVEYLLICGVLSATAVMTTFFSPEH